MVAPTVILCVLLGGLVLWWLIQRDNRKKQADALAARAEWFTGGYGEAMKERMMEPDAEKVGTLGGLRGGAGVPTAGNGNLSPESSHDGGKSEKGSLEKKTGLGSGSGSIAGIEGWFGTGTRTRKERDAKSVSTMSLLDRSTKQRDSAVSSLTDRLSLPHSPRHRLPIASINNAAVITNTPESQSKAQDVDAILPVPFATPTRTSSYPAPPTKPPNQPQKRPNSQLIDLSALPQLPTRVPLPAHLQRNYPRRSQRDSNNQNVERDASSQAVQRNIVSQEIDRVDLDDGLGWKVFRGSREIKSYEKAREESELEWKAKGKMRGWGLGLGWGRRARRWVGGRSG